MTDFLINMSCVFGGAIVGVFAMALVFKGKADALEQQEDDEAQVQALLDYQAMTALERQFPIAR